jgi:hypothetical protein
MLTTYFFLDVETIPSLDEYDNPISLGSGVIPEGAGVVFIRPDAIVDQLTLMMPKAQDGFVLTITTLDSLWSVDFVAYPKSKTSFHIPTGGVSVMPGDSIKLLYVGVENCWYLLS